MRFRLFRLLGAIGVGAALIALPAYGQGSDAQVRRVVEAIRQASKPEKPTPGLYSDWQVKPENISRWSKQCLKRDVSPAEFQVNRSASRMVVTCVVRDVLRQELQASKNNESEAVKRVAAWWLTGDSDLYDSKEASPYVERVLGFYQTGSSVAAKPTPRSAPIAAKPSPAPTEKPAPSPTAKPVPGSTVVPTKPAAGQSPSFYDRYMQAGNAAMEKKDTAIAALYYRRALDERPQDQLALQALRRVEALRGSNNGPRLNPAADRPATPNKR